MEAAGHGDGLSLTTLKQGFIGNHAIAFRENLKAIDVDLELNEVPVGEWIVARQKGDFLMVIASNTGAVDPGLLSVRPVLLRGVAELRQV